MVDFCRPGNTYKIFLYVSMIASEFVHNMPPNLCEKGSYTPNLITL